MLVLSWPDIHKLFQFVSAFFAFQNNGALLFLILKKSPKTLGAYKHLLTWTATFEIFYAMLDIIVLPDFFTYGCAFTVFVDVNKSFFNPFIMSILISIWGGSFGVSMYFFAIQFIYRYLVASGNDLLKTFKTFKILIWFSIPLIAGTIWGGVSCFLCGMSEITTTYLADPLLFQLGIDVHDTVYLALFLYPTDVKGDYYIHWESIAVISIMNILMTIALLTVGIFGVLCYKRLQINTETSTFSVSYQRLQGQLLWALIVQTMIPFFLLILPVLTTFVMTIFNIGLGVVSGICTILIAVYLAVDPLPNFFIIKNYRQASICILGTDVTWQDIENEMRMVLGTQARFGEDKKATSIGDMKGFMSRIALIQPAWTPRDLESELPETFIVKIASDLAFAEIAKLLNSDKDEKFEAKNIKPVLKILHNREVEVYQLLEKLNSPDIPHTKIYALKPFTDENPVKAFIISEALDDIDHIGVYENFQIDDVVPIVKSIAAFSALGETLPREDLSFAADSNLLANLMAEASNPKMQDKCYDQMRSTFPDKYSDDVERLIKIYRLYFSPKMLSKLGKVAEIVGHRNTLIHGDLWTSNLLCQKVSGHPQMRAIIDWQTVAFGSPGQDLARLFMNILSTEDRRQHLDYLLQTYYNTFVRKIGNNPVPYTLEQLRKNYQLMFPFLSVLVLPGIIPFLEHGQVAEEMKDSVKKSAMDKIIGLLEDVLEVHEKNLKEFPKFYE